MGLTELQAWEAARGRLQAFDAGYQRALSGKMAAIVGSAIDLELERNGGNVSQAARILGVARTTIQRRMRGAA